MIEITLRRDPGSHIDVAQLPIDWFEGAAGDHVRLAVTNRLIPDGAALAESTHDLLNLATAVYAADRVVPRDIAADRWTRELLVSVPISDRGRWEAARPELERTLGFLSGDRWALDFNAESVGVLSATMSAQEVDAVCLFSGGLDSLVGAIDLLADDRRVALVGHYETRAEEQGALSRQLMREFRGRAHLYQLRLVPNWPADLAHRPFKSGETTMRSRSFLFFSLGALVANRLGVEELMVSENGYIGLNVPLDPARLGSFSTRTTHPRATAGFERVLEAAGVGIRIITPARFRTKGEMLEQTRAPSLVRRLARQTMSCAHPAAGRFRGVRYGHCGYCYPCLIRRAALHRIALDRGADYSVDVLSEGRFLDDARAGHIRALLWHLQTGGDSVRQVVATGSVQPQDVPALADVYRRGLEELRMWLCGAGPRLRRYLPGC